MREGRIYWNHDWQFVKEYSPTMLEKDWKTEGVEQVTLPHTVQEVPYHYFDENIYQMVCGYRRCFVPEESWQGKHVLMTIEAAGHSATVYLNGKQLTEHRNGYTAFTVDLSKELCFGQENVLVVKVNSREDQNIPPFGHVIDYMTYGGLYREVYLEIKEEAYIEDVFARTKGIVENKPVLDCDVTVRVGEQTYTNWVDGYRICQSLLDADGNMIVSFKAGELKHAVSGIELWEMENPKLYIVRTQLYKDDVLMDTREDRIGFREVEFKVDGFYLNGKKRKLRGLNRHQSYPYVGYAMPKSMQQLDADILKNELGVNAVRTSHYPQSHYFIDRCDELGLLVFTEIPGWQHIGDEVWQQQAIQNTEEMVMQYRNHPSIILWGVRINESQDNDAFYLQTNEMAHRLDDTRQTSGVRYIQKSSLLEDIYS
ncbi:MAG: glycoside hydrolase family 2 protein, partial [Lachnospiraceae bacterium]|nr:glycoside hydrolase family 2 protein [Lachnospiraceae bacterium]